MLTWNLDPTKILTRHELAAVLADLNGRAARSGRARLNRAILRLAFCCGLRVSEMGGLRLANDRHRPDRAFPVAGVELDSPIVEE